MFQPDEASFSREDPGPVLLVDDNATNRKVGLILLERLGLQCEMATNGKEAVAEVSQRKFSVILMDCHMPEMDGFEATVAIRKLEELSGHYTPIIAVTALAMGGDRERCIAAGMDDYISKPIDKDLLRIKLNHWMRTDVVFKSLKLARKLRSHSELTLLEPAPIQIDELEEFYGHEALAEIFSVFYGNTEDMLGRIAFYLKERNSRAVAGLAHEVKASSASLGAKQVARYCLYLEQAVGQQDWVEADETFAMLQKSFAYLKHFVDPILNTEEPALEH